MIAIAWIRDRFFATVDRGLATIGVAVTIITSAISLALVQAPTKDLPAYLAVRDLLIWVGLLILTLAISIRYVYREAATENQLKAAALQAKLLSEQISLAHQLVHNYRDELFSKYFRPDAGFPIYTDADRRAFRHLCGRITYGVRDSLLQYFRSKGVEIGEDLSITVKLVISREEVLHLFKPRPDKAASIQEKELWIMTVYRDSHTYNSGPARREVGNRFYDIEESTAFRNVVRGRDPLFVHDDLESLGRAYDNENPEWRNYYNATMVVPIRYLSADGNHYRCYGLLAADSHNLTRITPLFNTKECISIMGLAADLLATFFLTIGMAETNPN